MFNEESIKRNSVIESNCNASIYKPLINCFKQNLDKLSDFIISRAEILTIVPTFSFTVFSEVFKNTREFHNLVFCTNPYDPKIYHIIIKNTDIPKYYTRDVIRTVAENGYNTKNIKAIIEYWKDIYNYVSESVKNYSPSNIHSLKVDYRNQSENYSNLNMNVQSLDGAYGTQIYKDRDSGRFYSVPSYDNYSDESNS